MNYDIVTHKDIVIESVTEGTTTLMLKFLSLEVFVGSDALQIFKDNLDYEISRNKTFPDLIEFKSKQTTDEIIQSINDLYFDKVGVIIALDRTAAKKHKSGIHGIKSFVYREDDNPEHHLTKSSNGTYMLKVSVTFDNGNSERIATGLHTKDLQQAIARRDKCVSFLKSIT